MPDFFELPGAGLMGNSKVQTTTAQLLHNYVGGHIVLGPDVLGDHVVLGPAVRGTSGPRTCPGGHLVLGPAVQGDIWS